MDIVTRNEINVNILVVAALLIAIDQGGFVIRPVDAEEPSVWIVFDELKRQFRSFSWWSEFGVVCVSALVVGK